MEFLKKILKPANYQPIIESKKEFIDKDFTGPETLGKDYTKLDFKPSKDIFQGKQKVFEGIEPNDIEQGTNGDCYFLSAISALSEFPERIEKLFKVKEINSAGCYAVTIYLCGNPVTVMVDDYYAVQNLKRGPKLAFVGSKQSELWVMIIEKAWAKLHKNYTIIDGGDARESLGALTGSPVDKFDFVNYKDKPLDLWKEISVFDKKNYVMCAGGIKQEQKGLEKAHAYTLMNTYEVKWNNEEVRLVQIRNPWGSGEWNGEWSDKDKVHWTPELNKQLNHSDKDDGTFFMKFEDFINFYNFIFVARYRDDFIFTNLLYDQTYAYAAFSIPKNLIGAVSAYQVSNRINNAYRGIDKGVKQLTVMVYKVEDGKIKPLQSKPVISNAIGYAHYPANFEPGNYVIEVKFPGEPNPSPYLSVVMYANQLVDLVKIDVKEMQEITPGMVNKLLSSVASAYSVSKNPSEKPEKSKEEKKVGPKKATGVKCKNGHDIEFKVSSDKNRIYTCEKCHKAFLGIVERWTCDLCDYDVCRDCTAPPADFKPSGPIPKITTCFRKHPIAFKKDMVAEGFITCIICDTSSDPTRGTWYCDKCNTYICVRCIPKEDEPKVSFSQLTTCEKGHPLIYSQEYHFGDKDIECDTCKVRFPIGTWRWNCYDCTFDLCSKCKAGPVGRTDLLCKRKHILEYSVKPVGKSTFTRCDRCHKSFKVTTGRYCCSVCCFDLCTTCEPYEDVSERAKKPEKKEEEAAAAAASAPAGKTPAKEERECCSSCIII